VHHSGLADRVDQLDIEYMCDFCPAKSQSPVDPVNWENHFVRELDTKQWMLD